MTQLTEHAIGDATTRTIRQTILDYFEGWYDADAVRMERALHPELAKRTVRHDEPGSTTLSTVTAQRMIEQTGQGAGVDDGKDRTLEIEVLDVYGPVATALVRSAVYHEYVHLVEVGGEWRIANALWTYTQRAGANGVDDA